MIYIQGTTLTYFFFELQITLNPLDIKIPFPSKYPLLFYKRHQTWPNLISLKGYNLMVDYDEDKTNAHYLK